VQHGYLFLLIAAVPDPTFHSPILLTPSVWSVLLPIVRRSGSRHSFSSYGFPIAFFLFLSIRDVNNRYLTSAQQRGQLDLLQEMNRMHLEERGQDEQLESRIASLEMAYRMQGEAQEAFDLTRESKATRLLYGDGPFGSACLLARRLAERNVRVIQIYYGNDQPWDEPRRHRQPPQHARASDQADRGGSCATSNRAVCSMIRWCYGGRVRPHADLRGAARSATTTPRASRCGWPRRRQGRMVLRSHRTNSASTLPRTACTSTTCTRRYCT